MEFLDNSVLPQSLGHLELLRYLLMLTFILFVPYVTMIMGLLGYSLWFDRKYKSTQDNTFGFFSKKSIDFITPNKSISFGFGIVPLLSAIFGYAQLLQNHSVIILESLFISLGLFVIGAVFLYKYRSELHYKDLIKSSLESDDEEYIIHEARETRKELAGNYRRHGIMAISFLLISLLFFVSAVSAASDYILTSSATNVFELVFNVRALVNYDYLLLYVVLVGTVGFVYVRKNIIKTEVKQTTDDKVQSFVAKTGILSVLATMLFVLLSLFAAPVTGLTKEVFLVVALLLILGLTIAVLFYFMIKERSYKQADALLLLAVLFIILFVVKDNFIFATSSQKQFYSLSREYETYKTELISSLGGDTAVEVSGEDIYNNKCIACHQFDKRLVGPPYNDVLSKYEGKSDELVKFILNPKKVNPDYPVMPNQGLKPNEAKAIAEYIVSVYKENQK